MTGLESYSELWKRALTSIVDTLEAWLDKAPGYVVDLVTRYWLYLWWSWAICWFVFFIVFVIGVFLIFRGFNDRDNWWDPSIWQITFWFFWVVIWLIGVGVSITTAMQGFIVPEVALIEHITNPSCIITRK